MSQVSLASVCRPAAGRRGSIEAGVAYASMRGKSENLSKDRFRLRRGLFSASCATKERPEQPCSEDLSENHRLGRADAATFRPFCFIRACPSGGTVWGAWRGGGCSPRGRAVLPRRPNMSPGAAGRCWLHRLGWDVRIKCRQHTGREAIRATLRGATPFSARTVAEAPRLPSVTATRSGPSGSRAHAGGMGAHPGRAVLPRRPNMSPGTRPDAGCTGSVGMCVSNVVSTRS